MPKDYQEIEEAVEQYAQCIQDMYFLAGAKVSVETWKNTKDFIRNALTTYGNARVEEIIKIAEGMKKQLIDTIITLPADHEDVPEELLKSATPHIYNQALQDLIEAIKK